MQKTSKSSGEIAVAPAKNIFGIFATLLFREISEKTGASNLEEWSGTARKFCCLPFGSFYWMQLVSNLAWKNSLAHDCNNGLRTANACMLLCHVSCSIFQLISF